MYPQHNMIKRKTFIRLKSGIHPELRRISDTKLKTEVHRCRGDDQQLPRIDNCRSTPFKRVVTSDPGLLNYEIRRTNKVIEMFQ